MKVVVGITFEAKSDPVYYADLRCAHSSQHDLHELFTHLRSDLYESFFPRIPNIAFTVRLNHCARAVDRTRESLMNEIFFTMKG